MRKSISTNPNTDNQTHVSSNPIVRHAMEWAKPEVNTERRKLLCELDEVQGEWTRANIAMLENPKDKSYFDAADKLRKRATEILAILNGRDK